MYVKLLTPKEIQGKIDARSFPENMHDYLDLLEELSQNFADQEAAAKTFPQGVVMRAIEYLLGEARISHQHYSDWLLLRRKGETDEQGLNHYLANGYNLYLASRIVACLAALYGCEDQSLQSERDYGKIAGERIALHRGFSRYSAFGRRLHQKRFQAQLATLEEREKEVDKSLQQAYHHASYEMRELTYLLRLAYPCVSLRDAWFYDDSHFVPGLRSVYLAQLVENRTALEECLYQSIQALPSNDSDSRASASIIRLSPDPNPSFGYQCRANCVLHLRLLWQYFARFDCKIPD